MIWIIDSTDGEQRRFCEPVPAGIHVSAGTYRHERGCDPQVGSPRAPRPARAALMAVLLESSPAQAQFSEDA
jgi:hypothetical protein